MRKLNSEQIHKTAKEVVEKYNSAGRVKKKRSGLSFLLLLAKTATLTVRKYILIVRLARLREE